MHSISILSFLEWKLTTLLYACQLARPPPLKAILGATLLHRNAEMEHFFPITGARCFLGVCVGARIFPGSGIVTGNVLAFPSGENMEQEVEPSELEHFFAGTRVGFTSLKQVAIEKPFKFVWFRIPSNW